MAEVSINDAQHDGTRQRARPRARLGGLSVGVFAVLPLLAFPTLGVASHRKDAGGSTDFAVGSGSNQFLIAVGESRLNSSARSDTDGGHPRGEVHAKGDPDGAGPTESFKVAGEVTCLRVDGNRAAIKYRFEKATGSAGPFEDGGIQVFIEDNGSPRRGEPADRTANDPPQPAGVFDANASQCDDPNSRAGYDRLESGNFVIRDATEGDGGDDREDDD